MSDVFERECLILAVQFARISKSFQALNHELQSNRLAGSVHTSTRREPSDLTQKSGEPDGVRSIEALRGALQNARADSLE